MNEDMWSNPGIMRDEEEISSLWFLTERLDLSIEVLLRADLLLKDSLK